MIGRRETGKLPASVTCTGVYVFCDRDDLLVNAASPTVEHGNRRIGLNQHNSKQDEGEGLVDVRKEKWDGGRRMRGGGGRIYLLANQRSFRKDLILSFLLLPVSAVLRAQIALFPFFSHFLSHVGLPVSSVVLLLCLCARVRAVTVSPIAFQWHTHTQKKKLNGKGCGSRCLPLSLSLFIISSRQSHP